MTIAEAQIILGAADAEEAFDAYEQQLFEMRSFFIGKPAFLKTYEGKWAKLRLLDDAIQAFGHLPAAVQFEEVPFLAPQEELISFFLEYHAERNRIRRLLVQAVSGAELIAGSSRLLELERQFAEPFSAYDDWTEAAVTIGKEPDSMEVLQLLRSEEKKGIKTLEALHVQKNKLPLSLLLILKRLSLLKNYLYS